MVLCGKWRLLVWGRKDYMGTILLVCGGRTGLGIDVADGLGVWG